MQPNQPIKGSPAKNPCSHIGFIGTADKKSTATEINSANPATTSIAAGSVPLYLIPQTLSAEIHAHGGDTSEISVCRTGQHVYAITLTKTPKKNQKRGECDAE